MRKYIVQYEDRKGNWIDAPGEFEYVDGCYEQAGKLFDEDVGCDYRIKEVEDGEDCGHIRIYPYKLVKEPCPICGKDVRHYDMIQTTDCHGIPYRFVCPDCYERVMDGKGYDGEYYTEADECF